MFTLLVVWPLSGKTPFLLGRATVRQTMIIQICIHEIISKKLNENKKYSALTTLREKKQLFVVNDNIPCFKQKEF